MRSSAFKFSLLFLAFFTFSLESEITGQCNISNTGNASTLSYSNQYLYLGSGESRTLYLTAGQRVVLSSNTTSATNGMCLNGNYVGTSYTHIAPTSGNITIGMYRSNGWNSTSATLTYVRQNLSQSITFNQPAAVPFFSGMTVDLSGYASSNSGLPISYSVISGPGSISGNILSVSGPGSVVLQASQGGNATYDPAQSVQRTLDVFELPSITNFTPNSAQAGASVTITGTGFSSTTTNNIVFFGGVKATVTAASSTSLTVTVPSGAYTAPITITNIHRNRTCISPSSFISKFSLTALTGNVYSTSFSVGASYGTWHTAGESFEITDLNNDGKVDFLFSANNSSLSNLINNTTGSNAPTSSNFTATNYLFWVANTYNYGGQPIAVSDFNSDGQLDIMCGRVGWDGSRLFAQSNGSFVMQSFIPSLYQDGVRAMDQNNDGKIDLFATYTTANSFNQQTNTTVSGSSTLSFSESPFNQIYGPGGKGTGFADFDNNGYQDPAVVSASAVLNIRPNSATGYGTIIQLSLGIASMDIKTADLNSDGKEDIIVCSSNGISVFVNTSTIGNISFAPRVDYQNGTNEINALEVSDINGDGKPDVIGSSSNQVVYFLNTSVSSSSLTFSNGVLNNWNNTLSHDMKMSDINGDGIPEIMARSGSLKIYTYVAPPSINVTGTLSAFNKCHGSVSANQTLTVSGSNLTAGITITPPVGFEVSTSATFASSVGTSSSPLVLGSSGTVSATPVYVRMQSSANNPTYSSANIVCSSAGATAQNISCSGSVLGILSISGTTAVNTGSTSTLSVSPSTAGTWSSSSPSVATINSSTGELVGVSAGSSVITFTSTIGCLVSATVVISNVAPITITNLSPTSGAVGTSVVLTGTGFSTTASNNVVYFGGVRATVTGTPSSTSMTVVVPASAISGRITLSNTATYVSVVSSQSFFVTNSNISSYSFNNSDFSVSSLYSMSEAQTTTRDDLFQIGDMNLDGKPDVIFMSGAGNTSNSDRISIRTNSSVVGNAILGTETSTLINNTNTGANAIGIVDINSDGKLDAFFGGTYSSNNSVLVPNASTSGSLNIDQANKVISSGGSISYGLSSADFNLDGKIDLVGSRWSAELNVLTNSSSSGTISGTTWTAPTVGTGFYFGVKTGDFNGDGKPDVVSLGDDNKISILINSSSIGGVVSFLPYQSISLTGSGRSVSVGDLDNDGDLDIAASSGSNCAVLINTTTTGSNTVSFTVSYIAQPAGVTDLDLQDLTGDGKLDIIVASGNAISINRNTTSTVFSTAARVDVAVSNASNLSCTDLDADGKMDVVFGYFGGIYVMRNRIGEKITLTGSLTAFSSCSGVASTAQTVTVSGEGLTTGIVFNAFAGIQYSTNGTTFSNTLTLGSTGTLAPTTVYIRMSAVASSFSGNISVTTTGDSESLAVSGTPIVVTTAISGTSTICAGGSTSLTASGASTYSWSNSLGTGASVSVSPSTTTTYTVTGTGASGCSDSESITVTVNALPGVSINGTAAVCPGGSTVLTASGGSSYVWNNSSTTSSITVSPSTPTTYSVTGTGANGCTNTASSVVTINEVPSITSQNTPAESICQNTTASAMSVTATGTGLTYQWYENQIESTIAGLTISGATSYSFTPPTSALGTKYYYCVVSGTCSPSVTSDVSGVISVQGSLAGTISNSNQNALCAGNSTTLSLAGHSGSIQWQSSTNNSTWSDISGSTTPTLNTGSLLSTTYYRTVVTQGSCTPAYTSSITVTVNTPIYTYTSTGLWGASSNWNVSCDQGATYSVATSEPTTPSIAYVNTGQTVTTTDLTIASGNQVIVKNGGKLTVQGVLTNNGTLKVESGGSLLQIEGSTQSGTGTYIAERELSGTGSDTPTGRFWYTGVPMTGAYSTSFLAGGPNKLWSHDEATGSYTIIEDDATALIQTKGYVFRGIDNNGVNGNKYAFTSNNIGNGDVVFNLTRTANSSKPGFNLVANPYPSHLSWNALYATTLVGAASPLLPTVWYRSMNASNVMTFDTYNYDGGVGTNNSGTTVTGIIAPFQSFWVRVAPTATSATMTATNAMRSHGTQNFLTLTPAIVRLNLSNGLSHDESIVFVKDDLSNDYDNRDSGKEIPSATIHQLYSLEGANKVAINGIGNAIQKDTLQLGLQIPTSGTYSINCTEHTFSDLVYLEDKITDAYIELSNTTTYSFTSEAGTFNNRFVLHFAPVPALPGQTPATAIAMPTSNWPQCNNVTSEDAWHAFTATTEAISIAVNTSTTDVLIELQDGAGNVVAQENAVNGIGNETLNFYGLIAGQTYKVGVHNTLSGEPTGTYGICVKSLKRGGCDYGAGPYSLCQYYKATWAGSTGVSYTFTFTGTSGPATGQTFTRTQNSDICVLSTVTPLLPYGSTYSVVISNTYTLTDGAGNTEQITVPSINGCQVITIAEPQTTLSNSNSCNNGPRFRGAVVSSAPWVCGASNWRWRFTEVNPLTLQAVGLPIELNRGAASNFLNLGTVNQLQSGKTYAVQTAPVFAYTASNYQWGPTQYMCIVGNTAMTLEGTDAIQGAEQGSNKDLTQDATQELHAVVYVTEGTQLNIQLSNTETNAAKRADIYDVTGKCVKSIRLVEGMNQVELSEASGIYMVRTVVGNQSETARVFIQK